jgi:hypothetical protein
MSQNDTRYVRMVEVKQKYDLRLSFTSHLQERPSVQVSTFKLFCLKNPNDPI